MIKKVRWLLIFSFFLLLIAGCGRNEYDDLKDYVGKLKQAKPPSLKKNLLEELHFPSQASYQAENLRTPFGEESLVAQKNPNANPLQAYPISVLRLIGTSKEGQKVTAYILTPDNMLFQVRAGDVIGDHYGKIIYIFPKELKIMEWQTDSAGKPVQQTVTMQLKDAH